MGFFGKLFKNKEEAPVAKKILRPRPARLQSELLAQVEFHAQTANGPVQVPIINISTHGIALDQKDLQLPEKEIKGTLNINGQLFDVLLSVIHKKDNILGCNFKEVPEIFISVFQHFFKLPLLASAFSKVDKSVLNQPDEGEAHWYFDRNENEVYYIQKDTSIIHFHIVIDGLYIEGDLGRQIKTGIIGDEKGAELGSQSSRPITFDKPALQPTISKGIDLLNYLSFFCEGDFNILINLLNKPK
jgi:hypothetical protein